MNLKKILFIICLTLSFAKYSQGNNDDEEELAGDDGEDDLNISVNNNNAGNLMKCIFLKKMIVSVATFWYFRVNFIPGALQSQLV